MPTNRTFFNHFFPSPNNFHINRNLQLLNFHSLILYNMLNHHDDVPLFINLTNFNFTRSTLEPIMFWTFVCCTWINCFTIWTFMLSWHYVSNFSVGFPYPIFIDIQIAQVRNSNSSQKQPFGVFLKTLLLISLISPRTQEPKINSLNSSYLL